MPMKHKIHTGPQDGKFQCSHGEKRYLLDGKKVQTGPEKGKFQEYNKGKDKRYLLK
jgi:hypothetical protein